MQLRLRRYRFFWKTSDALLSRLTILKYADAADTMSSVLEPTSLFLPRTASVRTGLVWEGGMGLSDAHRPPFHI